MPGMGRSAFVRATGMLCLLGIGLGLGTLIIYHLVQHFFRRRPQLPVNCLDNASSALCPAAETADPSENEVKEYSTLGNSFDASSICSLPESGSDINSNPDLDPSDDLERSVYSEDSCELQKQEDDQNATKSPDASLRRRKFRRKKEEHHHAHEIKQKSENGDSRPIGDSTLSDEHSGDFLTTSIPDDETPILRRKTREDVPGASFDHSTPDDHVALSGSNSPRWPFPASRFTLDIDDIPRKSTSFIEHRRDFPVKSRSCMSVDLGEVSSLSDLVVEVTGDGKLNCNAVSSLEKLQAELNNIQVEVDDMTKRVGKLQSQDVSQQYRLCLFDVSMDEEGEGYASPRRKSVYDFQQNSHIESEPSYRNSEYMWDYDFDAEVKDNDLGLWSSHDLEDENVGQLESFDLYRNRRIALDSIRRTSWARSQSADTSLLQRSDSTFSCLTPTIDDEMNQQSCSLYDVNRQFSGPFLIPTVLNLVSE